MENIQILDDCVKGTISVDREKLLVLSIPYENGWTAYVDGQETELLRANMMYRGLELTPGEHSIELRYTIPGMKISLLVSVTGIVIFVIALVIRRKRKNAA